MSFNTLFLNNNTFGLEKQKQQTCASKKTKQFFICSAKKKQRKLRQKTDTKQKHWKKLLNIKS